MKPTDFENRQLTFFDYVRPVWRFKLLIVPLVILAAAGAYAITNRQPKVYQTSTELYVGESNFQQVLNPGAVGTDRAVADDAGLITSLPVANGVRSSLKLPYPAGSLLGAITATPQVGSDFLTITAQTSDPSLAADLANGFAQAFLRLARANVVNGARRALRQARSQLAGANSAATRQALRTEIASIESVLISSPSPGQQVFAAPIPGVPSSPKPTRNAIFAGAIAFVLAVILAYLFDRNDRRVRRLDELEGLFELPVLAAMPHVRRPGPTRHDPYGVPSALREPYRNLRVNIDIVRGDRDAKVLMVTSALPEEGKSTVVRNLAISYRETGARVAIVEADLRRPVLASQFGVDQGPGLSDTLALGGELTLQRAPSGGTRVNGGGGIVDLAVAGAAPYDPTALLTEGRLRGVIEPLAADYDLVLIDSPPLLTVSDGLPLLGLVDGVLLVVRAGTATRSAAARFRRTIERVNRMRRIHFLGMVANDVADGLSSYYRPDEKRAPVVVGVAPDDPTHHPAGQ